MRNSWGGFGYDTVDGRLGIDHYSSTGVEGTSSSSYVGVVAEFPGFLANEFQFALLSCLSAGNAYCRLRSCPPLLAFTRVAADVDLN